MSMEGMQEPLSKGSSDWFWRFWFTLPIYPYGHRRTIRTEIVKDTIWTFDQIQGIFYVVVPIRMTVVRLMAGGLLIYAPVAPTGECIRLVNELENQYGAVKYIILPTVSGLEHKVFVGPFARQFPQAQVFIAPQQWSFPLNLPLSWLGFPLGRTHILPSNSREAPFADEFEYQILGPIDLGTGRFGEVALLHQRSHTLLLTDTVVSVPENPPPIVQLDPYPLLFHARDKASEWVEDNYITRQKGWQRIALFAFYFRPSALDVIPWGQAFRESLQGGDRSLKAYLGLFPFKWNDHWKQSFHNLRGNGRLFVAPILQTLILNRAPQETLVWADQVAQWDFQRIIPCHLDAPISATASEFRQAFAFLEKYPVWRENGYSSAYHALPEQDFQLLRTIDQTLSKRKLVPPSKEKV